MQSSSGVKKLVCAYHLQLRYRINNTGLSHCFIIDLSLPIRGLNNAKSRRYC